MSQTEPAMTELQESLTAHGGSALRRYQEIMVGSARLSDLLAYELAVTLLLPMPGALGYWLRQKLLGLVLARLGRGTLLGRGLTLRNPGKVSIGDGAVIDDYVTIDAKGSKSRIAIGERAMIGRGSILVTTDGDLEVGEGTNIGSYCRVATRARLRLGRSVLIAANCYLGASNHSFEKTDVPVIAQGLDALEPIVVEDNAWIGAGATIMYGVTIGRDAIVGAHSLVNQDIPPFAIAAGVPAKVIRQREPAA